jgi:hypothetical protein
LLPAEHSPLRSTGDGYQRYLTRLAPEFGEVLAGLIGAEAQTLIGSISVGKPMQTNDDLDYWEHKVNNGWSTGFDWSNITRPGESEVWNTR